MIISAGFDAHRDEPGGLAGSGNPKISRPLTNAVLDIADSYAGGKVVSVLEGGYNPGVLAGCVELHLQTLGLKRQATSQPWPQAILCGTFQPSPLG